MADHPLSELGDADLAEAAMPHWKQLGVVLPNLGERDVHRLLCWELANRRNKSILVRLHQRWTALRAARERKDLLERGVVP